MPAGTQTFRTVVNNRLLEEFELVGTLLPMSCRVSSSEQLYRYEFRKPLGFPPIIHNDAEGLGVLFDKARKVIDEELS